MPKPQLDQKTLLNEKAEEKNVLKGTFVSVMTLGIFIIASWLGVWILYLSR